MSSTQVGKLETNWAEAAVAGGLWAASAAANATLWALLAGIRAHNLCSKRSGVRASTIAILHPRSQRAKHSGRVTVSMRNSCLPSHPPFIGCFSYGGLSGGQRERGAGAGCRWFSVDILAGPCALLFAVSFFQT